ncbi:hypothetical protein GYMLUDRAFT_983361 [Collybiopsis luxurians FD-317 M1]|nr:hypothetical protein GYMLUDRAFT_983361 [Collybiopsis luxurians FD-317 M1]
MNGTTIPEFPTDIPIQTLSVIDYVRLKNGDEREVEALWQAATSIGFWYLMNHGAEKYLEEMYMMGTETMDLPLSEKIKYVQPGSVFGYKRIGSKDAANDGGQPTTELIDIAKDDALAWPKATRRIYPSTVNSHMDSAVVPFIQKSIEMTTTILDIFASKLGLPKGALTRLHSAEEADLSESRTIKTPKNLPPEKQTQFGTHIFPGSLCYLHSKPPLGGKQVKPSGLDEWLWLKPMPQHAICNIGLALSILSGGILRAPATRIIAPPGDLASYERWSQLYYAHPGDSVVLRPLSDESTVIASAVNNLSEEDREALSSPGGLEKDRDALHLGNGNR